MAKPHKIEDSIAALETELQVMDEFSTDVKITTLEAIPGEIDKALESSTRYINQRGNFVMGKWLGVAALGAAAIVGGAFLPVATAIGAAVGFGLSGAVAAGWLGYVGRQEKIEEMTDGAASQRRRLRELKEIAEDKLEQAKSQREIDFPSEPVALSASMTSRGEFGGRKEAIAVAADKQSRLANAFKLPKLGA